MSFGNQQLVAVVKRTQIEPSERPKRIAIWSGEPSGMPLTSSLPGACWVALTRADGWDRLTMEVDGEEVRGEAIRTWIEEHAPVTLDRARRQHTAAAV